MRYTQIGFVLSSALLAHSLMPISVSLHNRGRGGKAIPPPISANEVQRPIMDGPGPVLPPDASHGDQSGPQDPPAGGPGTVILSDVMGKDRSINVFAGLVRDVDSLSRRLDDSSQNSTVLAPLNLAMDKLPRKPWEDAGDYDKLGADAYDGDDGKERAQKNIRRFVEAHVVPASPWNQGDKVKTLGGDGTEIWWEEKNGNKMVSLFTRCGFYLIRLTDSSLQIQPGNIEVSSIASSVQNGQVVSCSTPFFLMHPTGGSSLTRARDSGYLRMFGIIRNFSRGLACSTFENKSS